MPRRIAIVLSEVFVRRLTPALAPFVKGKLDFRFIDIHRPMPEIEDLLKGMQPAGVVTEWLPGITDRLLALRYPTVIADTNEVFAGVNSVNVDDRAVGVTAADYFLRAGYRHFACLGNATPYARERMAAFSQTVGTAGFPCKMRTETELSDIYYMESWRAADPSLAAWLAVQPKPLALFAVHDPLGRLVCETCRYGDLHVPDDIAVIAANDDALVCNLTYPALSSVIIPWDGVGTAVGDAIEELTRTGASRNRPTVLASGPVVARESTDLVATQDPDLRRSLRYLQEHFREPLTIAGMCAELHLSRRSLERRFREHLARTPWELLCQLRVERAKRLLVETALPVSRVADLAGFSDPERLAVVFKRVTGRSPRDYRTHPSSASPTALSRAKNRP